MHPHRLAAPALLATALLAGCGKSAAPAASPAAATPGTAPANNAWSGQNQSAEEVAKAARADLRCPAPITTPARAGTAPVDDILGVRPGLSYEEAWSAVLCNNDLLVATPTHDVGFRLKVDGSKVRQGFTAEFAQPRVVKTSKQIMKEMQDNAILRGSNAVHETLAPGASSWYVGTMGVPGQERVLRVNREEHFAADARPTMDSLASALRKKYGATTHEQVDSNGYRSLTWAYDPAGRLQAEGTPLGRRCHGVQYATMPSEVGPDCGLVVEAVLHPQRDNAALVERLMVGVIDQANGYRMVEDTERALVAGDQQRRDHEAADAAKNVKAPSL